MPRAVPPSIHRKLVRDHGPKDPWARLLLFGINSRFGSDSGECFVGQETIAKDTCMGVSTIRAKTAMLAKQGWLALYPRGGDGRKWKSYIYRASVPDWIDLAAITIRNGESTTDAETVVTAFEAINGTIEDWATAGTLYPQKGRKRRPPPAAGGPQGATTVSGPQAPPADGNEHRQQNAEAPPADSNKHRQPLRGKSSLRSSSSSYSREARLTPSGALSRDQNQEPRVAGPERFARPAGSQEALRESGSGTSDEADRIRRIKRLLLEDPTLQTDWDMAARAMRCSRELVGRAVTEIYAERTTTVEDMPI